MNKCHVGCSSSIAQKWHVVTKDKLCIYRTGLKRVITCLLCKRLVVVTVWLVAASDPCLTGSLSQFPCLVLLTCHVSVETKLSLLLSCSCTEALLKLNRSLLLLKIRSFVGRALRFFYIFNGDVPVQVVFLSFSSFMWFLPSSSCEAGVVAPERPLLTDCQFVDTDKAFDAVSNIIRSTLLLSHDHVCYKTLSCLHEPLFIINK